MAPTLCTTYKEQCSVWSTKVRAGVKFPAGLLAAYWLKWTYDGINIAFSRMPQVLIKVFLSETSAGALGPPTLYVLDRTPLAPPDHPSGLKWQHAKTVPWDHHSITARYQIRVGLERHGFYIREADPIFGQDISRPGPPRTRSWER